MLVYLLYFQITMFDLYLFALVCFTIFTVTVLLQRLRLHF